MPLSVITGCEGQDGAILSKILLEEGHKVIGVTRRKSSSVKLSPNLASINNHPNFKVLFGDITDPTFVSELVQWHKPDYYFNFAAMSHVGQSFKEPVTTLMVNGGAVFIALDAIKQHSPKTRYYNATTSEMFGSTSCPENGLVETDAFHPRSPYGIAKLTAYYTAVNYREAYGLHASNGILFNHSSIYRGYDFATRKITRGVAAIKLGLQEHLYMGNMEAVRDEGHAEDYVKAAYLMLQQDEPGDYVVATGKTASIKEMLEYVCSLANLKYEDVYRMDERFMRPSDVPFLKGNPAKIKELGWEPKCDWKSLLEEMYLNDLKIGKDSL